MSQTKVATNFLGAGAILQTQMQGYNTYFQTNSSSYVDSGLTANITCSSTSSTVLIQAHINVSNNHTTAQGVHAQLLRGTTVIEEYENLMFSGDSNTTQSVAISHIDSPSSVSAQTYKIQVKYSNAAAYIRINNWATDTGDYRSSLILQEVSA